MPFLCVHRMSGDNKMFKKTGLLCIISPNFSRIWRMFLVPIQLVGKFDFWPFTAYVLHMDMDYRLLLARCQLQAMNGFWNPCVFTHSAFGAWWKKISSENFMVEENLVVRNRKCAVGFLSMATAIISGQHLEPLLCFFSVFCDYMQLWSRVWQALFFFIHHSLLSPPLHTWPPISQIVYYFVQISPWKESHEGGAFSVFFQSVFIRFQACL